MRPLLVPLRIGDVGRATGKSNLRPSPSARVSGAVFTAISGHPDLRHVSTSYIARHNLTMRMQIRRFTRLTNAFSKKPANLKAALALYFARCNLVRIHRTLRVTPTMAARVTGGVWELVELIR